MSQKEISPKKKYPLFHTNPHTLFDHHPHRFTEDADDIRPFIDTLAKRIARWPAESINATKQTVYELVDLPIREALRAEAYW